MIRDLLLAERVARGYTPKFGYHDYKLGATLDDWITLAHALRVRPDVAVSYDFETQDSLVAADESEMEVVRRDVTQVQVSLRPGHAIVSDWTPELLPVLRQILEFPNPKLDWNGRKFDRPILRDMQIRTDIGKWHDLMDCHHHAQPDLPRGLQFGTSFHCPEVGPWKHLSVSDPHWYGALDVDMPQRIYAGLRDSLSKTSHPISGISLWSGYTDQVVRLAPVLDRMSARGIPVDETRRLELDKEFTATLERTALAAQELFPESIRNVEPKNGFVRPPAELFTPCDICNGKGKVPYTFQGKKLVVCHCCLGEKKLRLRVIPEGLVCREFSAEVKCGCEWSKARKRSEEMQSFQLLDCEKCGNSGKRIESVVRWCRVEPFNPGSPQQVMRYIEWKRDEDIEKRARAWMKRKGSFTSEELESDYDAICEEAAVADAENRTNWTIPTDYKTRRPTTAADELGRLAKRTGDPLLPLVIEYKEVEKMRGTYVRGWKPGADGRVHTNFNFKPATGQLSSSDPVNAQNFPAHGSLAEAMKRMIVSAADLDGVSCP
jgi:hypothetical protein